MNPNQIDALEQEEEGEEEIAEDIDYDAIYGAEDVDLDDYEPSEEVENSYANTFKDVGKQFFKESLIGLGGTYGDLSELAGLPQEQSPASRGRNNRDFDILEKMKQPGYEPNFEDIYALSGDEEVGTQASAFPTSQGLRDINEALGGPGEAETTSGKYAGRIGKIAGGGAAFGATNPIPAVVGGAAGQTAEEFGADPLLQGAIEIATMIASQKNRTGPLSSSKKNIQDRINELRRIGYSDEEITLAINSANKGGKAAKIASKSKKTEQAFEDFAEHSDQLVSDILTSEIPGIEGGIQNVHQMASDAYGEVANQASNLIIRDSTPFINSATGVVRELRRNLGRNREAEPFLNRLAEAVIDSTQNPTAENFMNFYKELNKMGDWMNRSQRDRLITQVKNGIKDTFRSQGPEGRELATNFERVNTGIRRAYQAEEAHDLILKAATQDGIDYKKLNKIFDKADNVHLLEDVLGPTQTRNLQQISKAGKEIKDFDKSWKDANVFRSGSSAATATGVATGAFLYTQNWEGLLKVVGSKVGGKMIQKLAEESLTNPKFQNLLIRGLHAVKNVSPQSMKSATEAMQKFLDDEDIDLDLGL